MSDTKHLFKRDQTWWVKVAVPQSLHGALGPDMRRSLQTQDFEVARQARGAVVAQFQARIAEAVKQQRACRASDHSDTGSEPESGFEIVGREDFSDVTYLLEVHHPRLSRAAEPGQFVVVISHENGERIPLTIADFDPAAGTVTLVVQAVGKTTKEMQQRCQPGTRLHSLVGPMGIPSHMEGTKKVICVGGGLGIAPIFPQLRAFKQSGAYVIGIVGFRSRELMFWEEKFQAYCDEFIVCTDDGSAGIKGLVTNGIEVALAEHSDVDKLIAIGPPIMMKACAEATRPHGISTTVSLNPIMVDGTGMCGGCRVKIGDETKFACVEGPEFDGHQVDFDDLMTRLKRFSGQEKLAVEAWSQTSRSVES